MALLTAWPFLYSNVRARGGNWTYEQKTSIFTRAAASLPAAAGGRGSGSERGRYCSRRHVNFTVPAYSGRTFSGVVARMSPALDPKTPMMAVELDVQNARGLLPPGMYPEVSWPVRSQWEALH